MHVAERGRGERKRERGQKSETQRKRENEEKFLKKEARSHFESIFKRRRKAAIAEVCAPKYKYSKSENMLK